MARRGPKHRRDNESPPKKKKKRIGKKSATRMTLSAIMLFEFSACLLLVLRGSPFDWAAAALGLALPAVAWGSVLFLAKRLKADVMLVMLMNFLCGLGVILLYGLSPERGLRHLWMYLGGLFMFAVCALFIRIIRDWRVLCWLLLLAGIALLLLPVAIGQETFGAKNWFTIPLLGSFQPSELVKLFLLLILAQFFSSMRGVRGMLPGLLFAVACLGALMLQKDLGTALMYYLVTLLMYWAASSNLPGAWCLRLRTWAKWMRPRSARMMAGMSLAGLEPSEPVHRQSALRGEA